MALVDEGKVGTIIVKDMSRLGRDYLKVGMYTEVIFPNADIRFIAINNGVDSANQQDSDNFFLGYYCILVKPNMGKNNNNERIVAHEMS